MKESLLIAILFVCSTTFGQTDTAHSTVPIVSNPLSFSGYAEGYYSYDFNKPQNNTKPGFLYNHNRHNEFNINLAFLRGSYNGDKVRATVAVGVGTYMNANYAAEPGTLKNVYEADAGYKIGKKNLWIDFGILPSHIGFESAVGKDCGTLTRCLLAENTPFFEGGVRLTYTSDNGKWTLAGLLLNGWQKITRVDGNSLISYGTQIQYKPSATTTINYSTFIGTDRPDSSRLIRIYHNFYGVFQVNTPLGLTVGFDIGTEQKSKGDSKVNTVYSPVVIAKYSINDKWALAARGEYYNDANGILILTRTPNGFKTTSFSLNLDFAPSANVLVRFEARTLNSKDKIFIENGIVKNSDAFFTSAIALSF